MCGSFLRRVSRVEVISGIKGCRGGDGIVEESVALQRENVVKMMGLDKLLSHLKFTLQAMFRLQVLYSRFTL